MKDELERLIKLIYSSGVDYSAAKNEFNKRFILQVLNACRGNQCAAAREMGMHRNTLSRTIAALKLVKAFDGKWVDCFEAMRRKENANRTMAAQA